MTNKALNQLTIVVQAFAVLAGLVFCRQVHAQDVYLNSGENKAIVFALYGQNWLIVMNVNGACYRAVALGDGNGLQEDLTITAHSDQATEIYFYPEATNTTFCGSGTLPLDPIRTNGHAITVIGSSKNDRISAPGRIYAGDGDDVVFGEGSDVHAGWGNDVLVAGSSSDVLDGEEDDDWLCLDKWNAYAHLASGGDFLQIGTNHRCGSAEILHNIQDSSCPENYSNPCWVLKFGYVW